MNIMSNIDEIEQLLQESIDMKKKLMLETSIIQDIVDVITEAYKNGKKVILFGNGGSAADAQHLAGEFVGRFFKERQSLPALALHTNSSIVTALANDYGYDVIFKRQLEAYLETGDIAIGISTSGNSSNVVEALKYAQEKGAITIGFVGKKPCEIDGIADYVLKIPSESTPRIQEGHITAGHIICYLVEKNLFP